MNSAVRTPNIHLKINKAKLSEKSSSTLENEGDEFCTANKSKHRRPSNGLNKWQGKICTKRRKIFNTMIRLRSATLTYATDSVAFGLAPWKAHNTWLQMSCRTTLLTLFPTWGPLGLVIPPEEYLSLATKITWTSRCRQASSSLWKRASKVFGESLNMPLVCTSITCYIFPPSSQKTRSEWPW